MIFTYIIQSHALNRHGSVLNLDLATIWPQCSIDQVYDYEANIG